MATEEYEGRLVADGNGNLLADEGPRKGDPVIYDDDNDNFRFLEHGEPSHNEKYHKKFAEPIPTQDVDPDLPGYAGTADKPVKGSEHHFLPIDDRPEIRTLPDKVSAKASGHTHSHKLNGGDE